MHSRRYPERVTIVLDPDGALRAAQQEDLIEYFDDDGTLLASKYAAAADIDADRLSSVLAVAGAAAAVANAGAALDQQRARVESLEAEATALRAERDRLTEIAQSLDETVATLRAALVRAEQEGAALAADKNSLALRLDAADRQVAVLTGQIAILSATRDGSA